MAAARERRERQVQMAHQQVTLTEDERRAEHVALQLMLRGVREGLAAMPARSPWVRVTREFRNVLGAQTEAQTGPQPHEAFGQDAPRA